MPATARKRHDHIEDCDQGSGDEIDDENRAENEKRATLVKKENQRGLMARGFRPYQEAE